MAEQDYSKPVTTMLVRGLTVTPSILGVPYLYGVFIAVVTAIVFLITKNLFALLTCVPVYAIGRILIALDRHIFEILGVKGAKCPPMNTAFWKAKSYRA